MKSFIVLLSLLSLLCLNIWQTHAAHHAVLVAGSTYFWNYRHQADVFHAYQILIKYGIPPENIVTFAYDDVVTDPENPLPGQMFNKPSTGAGDDVYQGVVIDYKGDDVTSANFLSVLRGDPLAVQGKKVLKSTEEDFVFVYFADHGGPGFIEFPGDYLYADDFVAALNYMSDNKKYQQMVIYIEACESGSMFDGLLPTNINIYATTAAKGDQNSYATYCNPNNTVNGVSLKTCIGDLYSVNFLENLESVDPSTETLEEQFNIVFQETTKSAVQQFGDLSLTSQPIGNFESNGVSHAPLVSKSLDDFAKGADVDSRLVKLYYLNQRHRDLGSTETEQALDDEIESMMRFDSIFTALSEKFGLNVNAPVKNINFSCLKDRMEIFQGLCGKFSDYGLQYARYIYYTCSQGVDTYDYESALLQQCS